MENPVDIDEGGILGGNIGCCNGNRKEKEYEKQAGNGKPVFRELLPEAK